MKFRLLSITMMLALSLTMFACTHNTDEPPESGNPVQNTDPDPELSTEKGKTLVAYFSCTNTTKALAGEIAAMTAGTLYRIEPEIPYTSADLDYNTDCRANREQNDPAARPPIKGSVADMSPYDIVFLGYPIWWGEAPKVIHTFLEKHDLSGKIIVPFCTSHSSGLGSSDTNLHHLALSADWKPGRRFGANTPEADVRSWIESLNLPLDPGASVQSEIPGTDCRIL